MKVFGLFFVLLSILTPKAVNADCSDCLKLETFWNIYGSRINDGPCFINGNNKVCYKKGGGNMYCNEKDPKCNISDDGKPQYPPNSGTPEQCDSVPTVDTDTCSSDTEFYKQTYPSTTNHTMVKYGCEAGGKCQDACSYGFSSQAEIDFIVDKHNELRAKVANCEEDQAFNSTKGQPCAKNMKKLKWSDELAKVAQRWAQACDGYHDEDGDRVVPDFPDVGQNWARYEVPGIEYLQGSHDLLIQIWYNEVNDLNPEAVSSFHKAGTSRPGKPTGHYTQMVWAATTHVGCGSIFYKYPKDDSTWFGKVLVCNYGPAGNFLGDSIYDIASDPSEVGTGCTGEVENGLCV
ncbi:hypothetical protein TCAL_04566 [Tigriopus californicus]|uniref:SCP domain-containing protein n=1 Tax=Tigriopus californicus TaxID=6832 RepID=A0A553PRJ1_TIGCA|nr:venom allergen 5-like [Tigriopus californicus]TRY80281.1 hypothetical protein TCAL_04566 [Tigriopus californicus]|eukprot:TCALIF_04566-PA protein Name:"Similar to Venom allergen 5 (Rhynchium brunneum)" AED:0.09 eAED:0.09 QI:41/0.8/0.66/1/0.8/0.83/6/0/346